VRVVEGLGPHGAISVVVVYGEHDHASRDVLADALAALQTSVIVDLSWCTFIDSSVVGVLLTKHAELEADGRWLELVVPPSNANLSRTIGRLGVAHLVRVRDSSPRLGT
jgi:anti-anti-sigma regulatory factor